MSSVMWMTVPFIQKSCSNCCGILFRAWFDTHWIWVSSLRMVRLCFYRFFFKIIIIWMLHAASWTRFFVLSVFSFMHAPCHYFPIGVKNFPPRQHVSLPWTSIAGTCQRIASSTMRDSTKHDVRAHIVYLFHKRKSVKEGRENPSACLKWNGLFSKIRELSERWEIICTGLLLTSVYRQGQSVFATLFTRWDTP